MSEWHEGLVDANIVTLKTNACPFGLCEDWVRKTFQKLSGIDERGSLLMFDGEEWTEFPVVIDMSFWENTFRLRPDWKRPRPVKACIRCGGELDAPFDREDKETWICRGCQKPKEQGRWEYCEVSLSDRLGGGRYYGVFNHDGWQSLSDAFSSVGFGGIEFEEAPGHWHMSLQMVAHDGDFQTSSRIENVTGYCLKPATPKRVRFWIEGEK